MDGADDERRKGVLKEVSASFTSVLAGEGGAGEEAVEVEEGEVDVDEDVGEEEENDAE
jgi:hypothetical protein